MCKCVGAFKEDEEAFGGGEVEPGSAVVQLQQLFLVGGGIVNAGCAVLVDLFWE